MDSNSFVIGFKIIGCVNNMKNNKSYKKRG